MTEIEFAQSIKSKYPAYNDVPDDVLAKAVIEKYPNYESEFTPTPTVTERRAPMTHTEFGARIKQLHPGYRDVPDDVLAKAVIEKFPQYQTQLVEDTPEVVEEQPGIFKRIARSIFGSGEAPDDIPDDVVTADDAYKYGQRNKRDAEQRATQLDPDAPTQQMTQFREFLQGIGDTDTTMQSVFAKADADFKSELESRRPENYAGLRYRQQEEIDNRIRMEMMEERAEPKEYSTWVPEMKAAYDRWRTGKESKSLWELANTPILDKVYDFAADIAGIENAPKASDLIDLTIAMKADEAKQLVREVFGTNKNEGEVPLIGIRDKAPEDVVNTLENVIDFGTGIAQGGAKMAWDSTSPVSIGMLVGGGYAFKALGSMASAGIRTIAEGGSPVAARIASAGQIAIGTAFAIPTGISSVHSIDAGLDALAEGNLEEAGRMLGVGALEGVMTLLAATGVGYTALRDPKLRARARFTAQSNRDIELAEQMRTVSQDTDTYARWAQRSKADRDFMAAQDAEVAAMQADLQASNLVDADAGMYARASASAADRASLRQREAGIRAGRVEADEAIRRARSREMANVDAANNAIAEANIKYHESQVNQSARAAEREALRAERSRQRERAARTGEASTAQRAGSYSSTRKLNTFEEVINFDESTGLMTIERTDLRTGSRTLVRITTPQNGRVSPLIRDNPNLQGVTPESLTFPDATDPITAALANGDRWAWEAVAEMPRELRTAINELPGYARELSEVTLGDINTARATARDIKTLNLSAEMGRVGVEQAKANLRADRAKAKARAKRSETQPKSEPAPTEAAPVETPAEPVKPSKAAEEAFIEDPTLREEYAKLTPEEQAELNSILDNPTQLKEKPVAAAPKKRRGRPRKAEAEPVQEAPAASEPVVAEQPAQTFSSEEGFIEIPDVDAAETIAWLKGKLRDNHLSHAVKMRIYLQAGDKVMTKSGNRVTRAIHQEISTAERNINIDNAFYQDLNEGIMREAWKSAGVRGKSKVGQMLSEAIKDLTNKMGMGLDAAGVQQKYNLTNTQRDAVAKAAQRYRDEILDPFYEKIKDTALENNLREIGYVDGYFPWWQKNATKNGQSVASMYSDAGPYMVGKALKARNIKEFNTDGMSMVGTINAYIRSGNRTIHGLPAVKRSQVLHKLMTDPMMRDYAGWYIDNFAGKPKGFNALLQRVGQNGASMVYISRALSQSYYDSMIGLSPVTWFKNLSQTLTNTWPELADGTALGAESSLFKGLIQYLRNPRKAHKELKRRGVLNDNFQGDISTGAGFMGNLRTGVHIGMSLTESFLRGSAYYGGLNKARRMGITDVLAADRLAYDLSMKVNFNYGASGDIPALRALLPDMRTFKQYTLKEIDFVGEGIGDFFKAFTQVQRAKHNGVMHNPAVGKLGRMVAAWTLMGAMGESVFSLIRGALGGYGPGGFLGVTERNAGNIGRFVADAFEGKMTFEELGEKAFDALMVFVPGGGQIEKEIGGKSGSVLKFIDDESKNKRGSFRRALSNPGKTAEKKVDEMIDFAQALGNVIPGVENLWSEDMLDREYQRISTRRAQRSTARRVVRRTSKPRVVRRRVVSNNNNNN